MKSKIKLLRAKLLNHFGICAAMMLHAAIGSAAVYESIDGGKSWHLFGPSDDICDVAVSTDGKRYVCSCSGSIYREIKSKSGSSHWELIQTHGDDERSWDFLDLILLVEKEPKRIIHGAYLGSRRGLWSSLIEGGNWKRILDEPIRNVKSGPEGSHFYVNTWYSSYRIELLPAEVITHKLPLSQHAHVVPSHTHTEILYADGYHIQRSIDEGKTWGRLVLDLDLERTGWVWRLETLLEDNRESIYLFSAPGLYKSEDGGKTWRRLYKGTQRLGGGIGGVVDFEATKEKRGYLYLLTEPDQILKSSDGGLTWESLSINLKGSDEVKGLESDSTGRIYVIAVPFHDR